MAKLNNLSDLQSLFSKELEELEKEKRENPPAQEEEEKELDFGTKKLHVQYERKGRGGKEVSIVSGFDTDDASIKVLAKEIKNHCGLGGSVKNGEIIMQGKSVEKIAQFLISKGFKVTKNI
jgi:translation initiation factor 1